jgi:hypothetical protein
MLMITLIFFIDLMCLLHGTSTVSKLVLYWASIGVALMNHTADAAATLNRIRDQGAMK